MVMCFSAVLMTAFSVVAAKFAEVPINIETIEDFRNIETTGMNKRYVITGYLVFEDWEPLGSEDNPFTGKLEAKNPLTIKSFDDSKTKKVGLFAVNKGTILGLKVYNPHIVQSFDNATAFGFFAGENYGKITSCNVYMGTSKFEFNSEEEINIGSFCGINNGDIRKCVTTNQMIVHAKNEANFGMLCGRSNNGIIELCSMKAPSSIFSQKTNYGGLCGFSYQTKYKNNYIANTMTPNCDDEVNLGGVVGKLDFGSSEITNTYSGASVIITTKPDVLRVGCVGFAESADTKITNSVSGLTIQCPDQDYTYGSFFTSDIDNCLNCYFTSLPKAKHVFSQGEQTTYCDLTIKKLEWDSAIWKVSCSYDD